MRVISGYLKGRELLGYNVETTRPTMSRVKESMFAIFKIILMILSYWIYFVVLVVLV